MSDALDRLIRDLPRFDASGRAGIFGPDHEEEAAHLVFAEFGTDRGQPERPTVSASWDAHAPAIERAVANGARRLIDGKARDGEAALSKVVADVAELQREAINSNTPPPLADSTLAARRRRGNQSARSLVDRGDMLAAVDSETKAGGKGWR